MNTPEIGTQLATAGFVTNVHDLGAGDPVLLIHGSGPGVTAWANWRMTMPALAERFRVIAPDMVGFGYTERPTEATYSMSTWTEHAIAVLDALGIESAHVVGNSFGGSLALSLAINHPERVRRLVLMGSVGVPFEITPALDAVWGYEPSVESMAHLLTLFSYDQSMIGPDLAELRYRASIQPGFHEAFSSMFPAPRQLALDAMTHDATEIARITHPTLIVHGREDQVIPPATSRRLFELITDSELHMFGRCGHWTQLEHADRFNALVTEFLAT